MKQKVTIYSLAKELNMSPSMVSRAFSDHAMIAENKRKLVLQTAERYGYHPNSFASRLSGKTIKIGVIIYSKYKSILDDMLNGIEEAHKNVKDYKITYDVVVIKAEDKKSWECRDELMSMVAYDGVIVSGFSADQCVPMLNEFYEQNNNMVQLQSDNSNVKCLFSSKHDEKTAACIAAEFLADCLSRSKRKNVILFTGDTSSSLHRTAKLEFIEAAKKFDLTLLDCIDMNDKEEVLREKCLDVFSKYQDAIDGIYITSSVCEELCRAVSSRKNISLVTFDIYGNTKDYIANKTICASVFQDVRHQSYVAFDKLARHIISGEKCDKVVHTNIRLILKSNISDFLTST